MENFFNNFSFFLLLCSMSFYWVRAFFNLSIFSNLGKLTILSANLTMFFLLIYRGISENHFPLSNHAIKKNIIPFFKNFRFSERSKNKIEFIIKSLKNYIYISKNIWFECFWISHLHKKKRNSYGMIKIWKRKNEWKKLKYIWKELKIFQSE